MKRAGKELMIEAMKVCEKRDDKNKERKRQCEKK